MTLNYKGFQNFSPMHSIVILVLLLMFHTRVDMLTYLKVAYFH